MKLSRALLGLVGLLTACAPLGTSTNQTSQPVTPTDTHMVLATTTSTYDSGLLDFLLPVFTAETGFGVRLISVGTGAALQLGRDGEADVILVHARTQEDAFVAQGYAHDRHDVMYNDFLIVGPPDPIAHNHDVLATLRYIYDNNLRFVSRGDNSGTYIRELELWDALGLDTFKNRTNYLEVGQGMGQTLIMAVELNAFTLVDRSTWVFARERGELVVVSELDPLLLNPYGVLKVASSRNPIAAKAFVNWLIGDIAQQLIADYGVESFGEPLFFTW